jgi:DNA-binding CsgD family transcriptional regulator
MSKSALLRLQDVRDAYRLIGDCRDVGGDSALWYPCALGGLCRLIGGSAATGGEGIWLRPENPVQPMTGFDVGFESVARDHFLAYMRDKGVHADPIFNQLQHVPGRIITYARSELVADRDWYQSVSFNEYRKLGGCDHQLTSIFQVSGDGAITSMCVHRAIGDRDFSPREVRLMRFFHAELGRLLRGPLVSGIEPGIGLLSPRLRQTLAYLLEGDSERSVAARLGLSQATAHQYVTMLYRKFGVRSRSQLLAYVFRRLGKGRGTDFPASITHNLSEER